MHFQEEVKGQHQNMVEYAVVDKTRKKSRKVDKQQNVSSS